MKCAFIFRRDLRLYDNAGLNRALEECEVVYPLFIIDHRQMLSNPYKSEFAVAFMVDSLVQLDQELRSLGARLNVFYGQPDEVVARLNVNAVYVNEDYTPFSRERDSRIAYACKSTGKEFRSFEDYLLTSKSVKPPLRFSAFYNRVKDLKVREPEGLVNGDLAEMSSLDVSVLKEFVKVRSPLFEGGRREGLKLLRREVDFSRRDYPAERNYTMLSPHIKFGTVSIREAYYGRGEKEFRRELYWRDYFTLIAYYYPHVFGHSFRPECEGISWENNWDYYYAWTKGTTGYPIVDAAMRALNETGFINSRLRMIAAFFLVKVLFVDWRWGEKYFATKLVDYDPAVNNGNWQWVASTGVDYTFRVFNPWLQQEKFDPQAKFIKEWVEELKDVPPSRIHKHYLNPVEGYPRPMVDWKERVELVRKAYEMCRQ